MRTRARPPKPRHLAATGYQGAIRALVDRAWLRTTAHKDAVAQLDARLADPRLRELVKKLIRKAARMGIPLVCEAVTGSVAVIVHSRRKQYLEPLEWEIIGHLGNEISKQYHLGVVWGGAGLPSIWLGQEPFDSVVRSA